MVAVGWGNIKYGLARGSRMKTGSCVDTKKPEATHAPGLPKGLLTGTR